MTLNEAQDILAKISYKPGFRCMIERDDVASYIVIRFCVMVPDADAWKTVDRDHPRLIPITLTERFSYEYFNGFNERALIELMKAMIRRLEMHEVDEWLRYDGERVTEPHPELGIPRGAR